MATSTAASGPSTPSPAVGAPTGGSPLGGDPAGIGPSRGLTVAGRTGSFARRRGKRRWQAKRWQNHLWDATPTSVLVDKATTLTGQQNRRAAVRLLAVAAATTENRTQRLPVLEQLAVTAADAGSHRISCDAVYELQQVSPRGPDLWVTFANVALSRGNYAHADSAARSALELDPDHQGAWAALAASYAGLGWFESAKTCLDRTDRGQLTELQQWRIGRAVNRWALADTRWIVAAAVSAIVLGVLAVAIAASTPFAVREWRLRQLRSWDTGAAFETLATSAWRFEKRLRAVHIGVVSLSVFAFVLAMVFS